MNNENEQKCARTDYGVNKYGGHVPNYILLSLNTC